MSTFETVAEESVTLKRGMDLRVGVVGYGEPETHYGINVRQWITESSAARRGVTAGNGRTRSDYTGPDKFHGLSMLSPWQARELADLLRQAAALADGIEAAADATVAA